MPEKTVSVTRVDRDATVRLLTDLQRLLQDIIISNTPASTDIEAEDVRDALKMQKEALALARRIRRAR